MKTWSELSEKQQKKAVEIEIGNILRNIGEGTWCYGLDNEIDKAWIIAKSNRTPWFFTEILYHDIKGVKGKINSIARDICKEALYVENGEYIIEGVL